MADQSETDDDIRRGLLKLIKTGILQYYAQSTFFNRINIDFSDSEVKKVNEHSCKIPGTNGFSELKPEAIIRKKKARMNFRCGQNFAFKK